MHRKQHQWMGFHEWKILLLSIHEQIAYFALYEKFFYLMVIQISLFIATIQFV